MSSLHSTRPAFKHVTPAWVPAWDQEEGVRTWTLTLGEVRIGVFHTPRVQTFPWHVVSMRGLDQVSHQGSSQNVVYFGLIDALHRFGVRTFPENVDILPGADKPTEPTYHDLMLDAQE